MYPTAGRCHTPGWQTVAHHNHHSSTGLLWSVRVPGSACSSDPGITMALLQLLYMLLHNLQHPSYITSRAPAGCPW
jgi:hypothetical protein